MLSWPFSLKENGTATILPLHLNRRDALNPLGNPKVPLHTRTKRSQRLLMIVTLIGRQSDLVAIELNHDRHLLEPSLLSRNHARRRHQHASPKLPQHRYKQRSIVFHRRLVKDLPVRHHPITLIHIVPSLEMPSTVSSTVEQ